MAENKKSFLLYADSITTFEELSNEEAGLLIKHIFKYVNDLSPVMDDKLIRVAFEPIKQYLKRDLEKYETKKVQWSEAGKRSAEKKKANERSTESTNVKTVITESTVSVSDSVSDSDNVIKLAGTIKKSEVFEYLRSSTNPELISDEQLDQEADEFKKKYDGMNIKNLRTLCITWAGNVRPWQKQDKKLSSFI